jgi:hypothetical protein
MTTSTAIDVRPAAARPSDDVEVRHACIRGALDFQGVGRLEAGDAVRLSPAGADGAEVLVWELGA